jgi:hypothetical protein
MQEFLFLENFFSQVLYLRANLIVSHSKSRLLQILGSTEKVYKGQTLLSI